jgi:hypothetical protein
MASTGVSKPSVVTIPVSLISRMLRVTSFTFSRVSVG